MQKMMARILSRVFDPVWEMPLVFLLAIAFAVKEGLRWRFLGLILFIDVIVPTIFFLTMLYNKQLSSWDMRKRQERLPIYIFTLLCQLGGIWLAYELGKVEFVRILFLYYLIGLVFVIITTQYKISLHAGVNAILITSVNVFYGWRYIGLYLILVAVMWARVYQKHHTWHQVIVGAGLGGGIAILGYYLLGIV
jgi:hypothetical protein